MAGRWLDTSANDRSGEERIIRQEGRDQAREGSYKLLLGSDISRHRHPCGQPIHVRPFIVPPTWDKSESLPHKQLAEVWQRAAKELGEADNIIVIGYSYPPTDAYFKYLYALGVSTSKRLNCVRIINGPDGSKNGKNFAQLKGSVSADVFEFSDLIFTGAMHVIEGIVKG